jgi:hypothetical protein
MTALNGLWHAFVEAFREGLKVYFSPFSGFWQALQKLRIPSMVHDLFKTEKGVTPH